MPGFVLEYRDTSGAARRIALTRPLSAGRAPENDIVLGNPQVSRHHCTIVPTAQGAYVDASQSRNRIVVHGHHVERAQIAPGERFLAGGVELRLGYAGSPNPAGPVGPVRAPGAKPAMLPTLIAGGAAAALLVGIVIAISVMTSRDTGSKGGAETVVAVATIGADGGAVGAAGQPCVIFPAGALSESVTVTVKRVSPPAATGAFTPLTAIDVDLDGRSLSAPATVTIPVPRGNGRDVIGAYWDADFQRWVAEPSAFDATTNTLTIKAAHFSIHGAVQLNTAVGGPLLRDFLAQDLGSVWLDILETLKGCNTRTDHVEVLTYDSRQLNVPPPPDPAHPDEQFLAGCLGSEKAGSVELTIYNTRLVDLNVKVVSQTSQKPTLSEVASGRALTVPVKWGSQLPVIATASVPQNGWVKILILGVLDIVAGTDHLDLKVLSKLADSAKWTSRFLQATSHFRDEKGMQEQLLNILGDEAIKAGLMSLAMEAGLSKAATNAFLAEVGWERLAMKLASIVWTLADNVDASAAKAEPLWLNPPAVVSIPPDVKITVPPLPQPCGAGGQCQTPTGGLTTPAPFPTWPITPTLVTPIPVTQPPTTNPPQTPPPYTPPPYTPPPATQQPYTPPTPPPYTPPPVTPATTVPPRAQPPEPPYSAAIRDLGPATCGGTACERNQLVWSHGGTNLGGFRLYRQTVSLLGNGASGFELMRTVGASTRSYDITTTWQDHAKYCWGVSAFNSTGESGIVDAGCETAPDIDLPATVSLTTNKSVYDIGETITVCYRVSRAGHVRLRDYQTDGTMKTLIDGIDDGTGGCISGTVTGPAGVERLHLDFLGSQGQVLASADASFTIRSPGGGGGGGGNGACTREPSQPTNIRLISGTNTLTWDVTDPGGPGCTLKFEVRTFGGQVICTGSANRTTLPTTTCNSGYFVGAANQNFGFRSYSLWPCTNMQ